jgi:hypothetical protein
MLLVRAGVATEESVNRALAIQGFAGGRLGTLLLEKGSVSEDDLGAALAEQHHCEYVPWRVLGSVPATVPAALPAKFAIRHSAVPVEIGEGFLRLVLRDPGNLRILDDLFFVTGKKIVPCVAPEVRIYQALEKFYGERRTPRFAILAEKLSRPIVPSVVRKPLPPPPDFSAPPGPPMPGVPAPEIEAPEAPPSGWQVPDVPPVGWGGLPPPPPVEESEPDSIPWEELPASPAWPPPSGSDAGATRPPAGAGVKSGPPPAPPAVGRPAREREGPAPPMSLPEFPTVRSRRTRDDVFAASLEALRERFRTAAVFAVRREGVAGWGGAGEQGELEGIGSFALPWDEPSLFLNVKTSCSFYLGPLPPLPRHRDLAQALGGWPAECLLQPVVIRDRVVAFFYAESASPQGATPTDLAYIRQLAADAAAGIAESIRLSKKRVI